MAKHKHMIWGAMGVALLAAFFVVRPFFFNSGKAMARPAGFNPGDVMEHNREFGKDEMMLGRSVCEMLKSMRMNYHFLEGKDKTFTFEVEETACNGSKLPKKTVTSVLSIAEQGKEIAFQNTDRAPASIVESNAINRVETEVDGHLADLCQRTMRGEELGHNTRDLNALEKEQIVLDRNPIGPKFIVIKAKLDPHEAVPGLGRYLVEGVKEYQLSDQGSIREKGLVTHLVVTEKCPDQGQRTLVRKYLK